MNKTKFCFNNNYTTYYDRTMSEDLVAFITKELPWLIDYVKEHPCLDFQTGHDPKSGRSWFSIYRGTSRVLTISMGIKAIATYDAAESYRKLIDSSFFENPNRELFDKYLENIDKADNLARYYIANDGTKKEGYYQTLIGRRYTFGLKPTDDFFVIDKEFVVGFKSEEVKTKWNEPIIKENETLIKKFKDEYGKALPKEIKAEYGEFDFLGLSWDGDIYILELKQDDEQKTSLSPIQTSFYKKQYEKLLKEDDGALFESVRMMVQQKIEMHIINLPEGRQLPTHFSGKIISCVIVGEKTLSPKLCDRYKLAKNIFLPEMKAYTCAGVEDGTLIPYSELED